MSRGELRSVKAIKEFLLAGRATVTVQNTQTGNRFTFRVSAPDRKPEDRRPPVHFVALLNGPDNVANYVYMGIVSNGEFRWTAKSRVTQDAPSFKAFAWLWYMVSQDRALPEQVRVFHEGHCGRCGRTLTVPESIQIGFGPECWARMA